MPVQKKQKILFVVNPVSGDIDKGNLTGEIDVFSRELNFIYRVYHTAGEKQKDEQAIRELIGEYHPDKVMVAGGDGTCNVVAKILLNSRTAMGILPAGSANGLARDLGVPSKLKEACEVLIHGKKRKIDVLLINRKHISVHLSDIGLNARIVERFEKDTTRGLLSYARHFAREIFSSSLLKFKLKLDRKVIYKKAYMAVIANAARYGTGAMVNPEGEIDDGYFEVLFIRPYSLVQLLKMVIFFFTRPARSMDYMDVYKCREAVIFNLDKKLLQVDGEILGRPGKISVEILHQSLTVMVPPE